MNLELARYNMVEQQVRASVPLREDVRELLLAVPRELFVPAPLRHLAFADVALPLADGAAMFPPRLDARIIQALAPRRHEMTLEIGTGSGYTAALLAAHSDRVTSYEIRPELAAAARDNLHLAGVANAEVIAGDGLAAQHRAQAFGLIVVAGGVDDIPEPLLAALRIGGRLVAFVGQAPCQSLRLVTRLDEGSYLARDLAETVVAPLVNLSPKSAFRL